MTLPAFRQEVHTLTLRTVPGATWARTGWMFGFQRRWVRRWECETLMPKPGPLPHTSHTAATPVTPIELGRPETADRKKDNPKHPDLPGYLTRIATGRALGQIAERRSAQIPPAAVHHGRMESLDVATVQRWFDAVPSADRGLPLYLAGPLSAAELRVLDAGRRAVTAAMSDGPTPTTLFPDDSAEDAADWLATYLVAFAAGLADARRAEGAPPGHASPLHVVAGLITGAAAVAGRPATQPWVHFVEPDELDRGYSGPSASDAAHQLGAAAADEAVSGAPLERVTRAAQAATPRTFQPSAPEDPARTTDLHRCGLLVRLINALTTATVPPPATVQLPSNAPGWRPACVGTPGEHAGEPLLAEITFLTADEAGAADLAQELRASGVPFGTFCIGGSLGFHIHTEQPGAVVSEIFSLVLPFDLSIARLPDR